MNRVHLLCIALAVGCSGGSAADQVMSTPSTASPRPQPPACGLPDQVQACELSEEELRAVNLRYADRLPYVGNPRAALDVQAQVQKRLASIAKGNPGPDELREALSTAFPELEIATSDNAVRMAGTAFALAVDGGCVFGQIYLGELRVNVGGFINDGGCLAVYGH
jgi:hypothetical protein